MRLGLWLAGYNWSDDGVADTLATIARRAERSGLFSFWLPDHFLMPERFGDPKDNVLEAWTTLGFLAGLTHSIKLGTLVTGVTYRNPGLLMKMATTLDVLSHGRSYLGLGAAWYQREHEAYGFPFPTTAERFERLEETLQIARHMWSQDAERPYRGKHYNLSYPYNAPRAIQQPRPRLLVAGTGETRTLRLVARYADACNFFLSDEETGLLDQKLSVLQQHCQDVGRPYQDIEKTTVSVVHLTRDGRHGTMYPAHAIHYLGTLAEHGVDHAIFHLANVTDLEPFDVLRDVVVPATSALQASGGIVDDQKTAGAPTPGLSVVGGAL